MAHIENREGVKKAATEACPRCGARLSEEGEWATAVSVVIIAIGLFVFAALSLLGVIG